MSLSAILVREFGKNAPALPSPYGKLASFVKMDFQSPTTTDKGPEFHWSFLRKKAHERDELISNTSAKHSIYVRDQARYIIRSLAAEPTAAGIIKVEFESQSVDLATSGIVNLDPNLLSVLLLNQHPSFVELVMRKHPMRVQPLGGASSIRQSRIPSIATTSGPP